MANLVSEQLKKPGVTFIEAGTGTGKSFAYTVPTVASTKKTIISTATIALQTQLLQQDLPHVIDSLDEQKSTALLKGRNNYLCRQKLHELHEPQQSELLPQQGSGTPSDFEKIFQWAEKTRSGDKEDLTPAPPPELWKRVSIGTNECPGAAQCPSGDECFSEAARRKAFEADIVVTNHHLYGLDLAAGGTILPEHDVVIFDEAHQLPEIFSQTCGIELSNNTLTTLTVQFQQVSTNKKLLERITLTGSAFEKALTPHLGKPCELTTEIVAALISCRDIAERVGKELRSLRTKEKKAVAKIERCSLTATRILQDIDRTIAATKNDVIWVDERKEQPVLKVTPLEVSALMQKQLWEHKSGICTSATLPEQIAQCLGAEEKTPVHQLGSPFPYKELGKLYCPTTLPNPNHKDFRTKSHKEMKDLIEAAGGRTLCLFTSYSAMYEAKDALESTAQILVQGELPKNKLLKKFKDKPETTLLATMSFWQGVDIPGSSLHLVIIDRIPFPRPDTPVIQAQHAQAGKDAFTLVDLPRAQILLAQAAGRLIRHSEDQGVVTVLDPRLATNKNYRWQLINALPEFQRTKNKAEVLEFLQKLDQEAK